MQALTPMHAWREEEGLVTQEHNCPLKVTLWDLFKSLKVGVKSLPRHVVVFLAPYN